MTEETTNLREDMRKQAACLRGRLPASANVPLGERDTDNILSADLLVSGAAMIDELLLAQEEPTGRRTKEFPASKECS